MTEDDIAFRQVKWTLERSHDHYHAVLDPKTWQKFRQALKHYIQALDEQEKQKRLRYHERLQKLTKIKDAKGQTGCKVENLT